MTDKELIAHQSAQLQQLGGRVGELEGALQLVSQDLSIIFALHKQSLEPHQRANVSKSLLKASALLRLAQEQATTKP